MAGWERPLSSMTAVVFVSVFPGGSSLAATYPFQKCAAKLTTQSTQFFPIFLLADVVVKEQKVSTAKSALAESTATCVRR